MKKFKSKIGELSLSKETMDHVNTGHPIVVENFNLIAEVLIEPDQICYSNYDQQVLLFYKFFAKLRKGKYIVIVAQRIKRKIITVYVTDKIKAGETYEKNN